MSNVVRTRIRVVCPECLVSINTTKPFCFQCHKCKRYFPVKEYILKEGTFDREEQRKKFQLFFFDKLRKKHYLTIEDAQEEEDIEVTEESNAVTDVTTTHTP